MERYNRAMPRKQRFPAVLVVPFTIATFWQHPRGAPLAQGTHVTPSSLEYYLCEWCRPLNIFKNSEEKQLYEGSIMMSLRIDYFSLGRGISSFVAVF